MKKISTFFVLLLTLALLLGINVNYTNAKSAVDFEPAVSMKSSILVDSTGKNVLYAQNEKEKLPVASIIKLTTILLAIEEIDKGNHSLDEIIIASENASGMGGSQIFLDANAEYTFENLLKSVIVCSANDSSVAIAEHIAGSEANFVERMNKRAKELGMNNTNYVNCNGLPAPNQYSCAEDIAKVTAEVFKHDIYHNYCKIWMEDFVHPSGRISQMVNTNKLVKHYQGCLGGKTGSTNEAGYCLSTSAERNGMQLISVVLGAQNSKERFKGASDLLNFGFANFSINKIFNQDRLNEEKVKIQANKNKYLKLVAENDYNVLSPKGETPLCSLNFNLPNSILSVKQGEQVGHVEIIKDGAVIETIKIFADETIKAPGFIDYIKLINESFI